VEERVVVAVGASPSDPRHIELTLFGFDEPVDAAAASAFVGNAASVEPVDLPSGPLFAFLPTVVGAGAAGRRDLQLLDWGPSADSVVRGDLGQGGLVVGAARVLQPRDVDVLVAAFLDGSLSDSQPLPVEGMSILLDEALGDGVIVELDSVDGPIQVEMYDDTAPAWFDYAARDLLADGIDPPDLGLGQRVAIEAPSSFGVNGQPLGQKRLFWWDQGRLTMIAYPPTIDDATISRVAEAARPLDLEDLLVTGRPARGGDSTDAGPTADQQDDQSPQESPSPATMDELQAFVETLRGVELGQSVEFDFVDRLPSADFEGFFVSTELWLVAVALDLVDEGHDQRSADLARVERVRGLPGTVILQSTEAETNMIVAHEIAHIVDDQFSLGASTSQELVEPLQALMEGNAHRVAYAYVESLPAEQREQIPAFPGIFPDGDPRLSRAMQDIIEFPYDEGRTFATALATGGGEQAVELALQRPPNSSEHILFPDSYLADDQPVAVAPPEPPGDVEVVETGVLSAYLLSLAAREATGREVQIVAGWAGDSYVVYRSEGRVCLAASVRMDTEAAAEDLAVGLRSGRRRVGVAGDVVGLTSCSGDLADEP